MDRNQIIQELKEIVVRYEHGKGCDWWFDFNGTYNKDFLCAAKELEETNKVSIRLRCTCERYEEYNLDSDLIVLPNKITKGE